MASFLIIKPRSRIFHGHDWVYASDILSTRGKMEPGDVIGLKDTRGQPLGSAIYNNRSQIVARRFSFRKQDLDAEFFKRRIERALAHRATLPLDQNLMRVVWSESDGIPGVIIDRYGPHVVLQTLTCAMDQRKDLIVQAIKEVIKPRTIVERNDTVVRKAEGLEPAKSMLHGSVPAAFEVKVGKVTLLADLMEGQKTGLYLDQCDNYARVAAFAKGRRVLDCFANQGGFAQACALAGARQVTAIDSSEPALELARRNARSVGVSVHCVAENAFDYLKTASKREETYDLIILDPPSFTKTKSSITDALRGYKEIHLRALSMLQPGGILATFSCSHHISGGDLRQVINSAGVDSRRSMRRVESYHQRADHPVVFGIPETEYLRGYAVEVMGGW
jgi:23S rRNA (cytosine1962-C5)-methyltransferase